VVVILSKLKSVVLEFVNTSGVGESARTLALSLKQLVASCVEIELDVSAMKSALADLIRNVQQGNQQGTRDAHAAYLLAFADTLRQVKVRMQK
jgi:hypothetical protein